MLISAPLLALELGLMLMGRLGLRHELTWIAWLVIAVFVGLPIAYGALMRDRPPAASRRPRLRISVRSLIVLVLLVGGWLGWMVRGANVQREAVRTITRAGGFVQYDWEVWRGLTVPGARPPAPNWLVNLIGIDHFGNVVAAGWSVNHLFHDPEVSLSDETLASLGALTHLESLGLAGSSLDDAGLARLSHLRRLKWLALTKTHVTDAGLIHLNRMSDLRWLSVTYTGVTDTGKKDLLKALPGLEIAPSPR
jgi:hypothetical protein